MKRLSDLSSQVQSGGDASSYPKEINNSALRALFDNLDHNEKLALAVDEAIRDVKKAGWRGNKLKEREVRIAIKKALDNERLVDTIFEMVKHRNEY